jgi:hypothetical protein
MVQLQSLLYTGPSFDTLYAEYAQKGRIDDRAPVKASGEITINYQLVQRTRWQYPVRAARKV